MKIAILAWGSLIWDPRNLKIDKTQGNNGWFDEGPMLPIEFARISRDGRLTLVIVPGKTNIQTHYSISKYKEIDHAILDLALREDCDRNRIGYFNKIGKIFHSKYTIQKEIDLWLINNEEIDSVIWTELSSNFKDKMGKECIIENIINYLKYLPLDIQIKAEEYIRKTPSMVQTPVRRAIEDGLGWTQIPMPA